MRCKPRILPHLQKHNPNQDKALLVIYDAESVLLANLFCCMIKVGHKKELRNQVLF
ncbi:uncharacterized protein DS421_11g347300 [Arachis hypogaea]|nr:uncharacterized protein DS421_11g347300 [Arachis hypogaea]